MTGPRLERQLTVRDSRPRSPAPAAHASAQLQIRRFTTAVLALLVRETANQEHMYARGTMHHSPAHGIHIGHVSETIAF